MNVAINTFPIDLTPSVKPLVERRIRFALTRFDPLIREVVATLSDESGPHGEPSRKCRIVVWFRGRGSVLVESSGDSYEQAATIAADRAGRSVARMVERRRHSRRLPVRNLESRSAIA